MPYKKDLEDSIRASYDLIRQYEDIRRFSDDPKEQARAQRAIAEQWRYIKNHLDDYIPLCKNMHLAIADDLKEITAHFPEFNEAAKPEPERHQQSQQQQQSNAIEVFISYAHEDESLRNELVKQLSLLQRQGLITCWYDRQIEPGALWEQKIDAHLETSQVILLLISPDFMASSYCYGIEMRRALERRAAGEARVIPVILRPVDWHTAPFGKLQSLPLDGKAVTTWKNRDEAFLDIAKSIRKVVERA